MADVQSAAPLTVSISPSLRLWGRDNLPTCHPHLRGDDNFPFDLPASRSAELRDRPPLAKGAIMIPPPESLRVNNARVACDGSGADIPAALGHPRVFLEIDEKGFVDCGYCDRRFILAGGPADKGAQAA